MSKWKKLRTNSFQLGRAKVWQGQGPGDWVLQFDGCEVGTYNNCDDAMSAGERMVARLSAAPRKLSAEPRKRAAKAVTP